MQTALFLLFSPNKISLRKYVNPQICSTIKLTFSVKCRPIVASFVPEMRAGGATVPEEPMRDSKVMSCKTIMQCHASLSMPTKREMARTHCASNQALILLDAEGIQ